MQTTVVSAPSPSRISSAAGDNVEGSRHTEQVPRSPGAHAVPVTAILPRSKSLPAMSSHLASADSLAPRSLASPSRQGGQQRLADPDKGRLAVSAAPSTSGWGAALSRGRHLLQPNVALLRAGARQLAFPALWMGGQMQMHPQRTALVVNALQQASSTTGVPQRLEAAADLLTHAAGALVRQLQERNDVDAAGRIAAALVDLDAARLAGELLGEAIYGLLKQLPDRYVVGLQMFLGIGGRRPLALLAQRTDEPGLVRGVAGCNVGGAKRRAATFADNAGPRGLGERGGGAEPGRTGRSGRGLRHRRGRVVVRARSGSPRPWRARAQSAR